ncbi:protein ALTERED PHOSPHATE STARVATION RESPONSE 1-like [Euphorbia lathyris]|uniref:protein ALTERED PHOSPHATE STARVATION RESPONSE 1-like n=1 Tax=Euphorbia lathyris TaxID=212925 RepID=UPI0033136EFB
MGCVASKLEEEEQVVSICRKRKHQLKLALERRYALADAHCRYCQSLYAVAAAINLFIARHAPQSSQLCFTLPPTPDKNVITNPMFLQQGQLEQITHETMGCHDESSDSSTTSDFSEDEATKQEEEKEEQGFGSYLYMQMPPAMPQSPQTDFGWDFFNPFDTMRPEIISGYRRVSDEDDDLKVVREEEGIPDLEEEGEKEQVFETEQKKAVIIEEKDKGELEENGNNVVEGVENIGFQGDQKGLTVIDTPETGRELLDALKDIEDHFIRAYDSGNDVSRMLEANRVYLQSGVEEIKENSNKLLQISWNRSTSSKSSSCKSLVVSSSKGSSPWTEYKNELFDDYGGMDSGSHSQTLGRLYAWEKKLYEEVKAGDSIRKIYEKKCSRLRNYDVGGDELTVDKTRAAVKDLYARILVAIRSAESISKRIEKLRDEELQPQIVELLKGLTHTWKIMLESHETQDKILSEVKYFACPTLGKFCNDSHRLATLQLEAEILNWRACFTEYFAAQKAYVEALNGWLTKFLVPEVEFYSRGRRSTAPYRASGPPLLIICHNWLSTMGNLPDKSVSLALKSFSKDVRALWVQQRKEQQQKRRVDDLAKELDRRTLSLQKAEARFVEIKLIEYKPDPDAEQQSDHLTEKKDQLDIFREKLDIEKEKHHNCMQETHRITLSGLQTGFSAVFETLTEFSKTSMKMYNDLINCSENAGKLHNQSCIEGKQVEENGSS